MVISKGKDTTKVSSSDGGVLGIYRNYIVYAFKR